MVVKNMGKNVNKKFTVNLEISTDKAVDQVRASAEVIKKTLKEAITEGISTKDLRNMAKQINNLFSGLGKGTPIDIDKYFKGRGNAAERIKLLTDSLSDLFNVMESGDWKSGFGGSKLTDEAQKEIDSLKKQITDVEKIKKELSQAMTLVDQYNTDGIVDGIANTEKEALDLLESFKTLYEYINNPNVNRNSLEYFQKLSEYLRTAARLASTTYAYSAGDADYSINNKAKRTDFFESGQVAASYVEDLDEGFGESLKKRLDNIIKNASSKIQKIQSDPKSMSAQDQSDEFEQVGTSIEVATEKLEKFLTLSKELSLRSSFESGEVIQFVTQLESAKNELQELANQGLITEQQIQDVLASHSVAVDWMEHSLYRKEEDLKDEIEDWKQGAREEEARANAYSYDASVAENKLLEATKRIVKAEAEAEEARSLVRDYELAFNEAANDRDDLVKANAELKEQLAKKGVQDVESTKESFFALTNEIINKTFNDAFTGATDDVEIGKYTERLKVLKAELDTLGEQGKITADELLSINDAFNFAERHLQSREAHYTGYGDGRYDFNYYDEYKEEKDRADLAENEALRQEEAANRLLDEKFALQEEIESLRSQLKDQQNANNETTHNEMNSNSIQQLEALQQKLLEVRDAVDAKTQAFENESIVVDATVDAEIAKLNALLSKLEEVKSKMDSTSDTDGLTEKQTSKLESVEPVVSNIADDKQNLLIANAFKGMKLKKFIKNSVNKDAVSQLEDEFYKFAQTYVDEDADAMYAQASNIADLIVENSKTFRERKEENIYEDAFKALQMTYTDDDAAAMGPQLFERAKSILGRKFQKLSDKNKHYDRIDQAIHTLANNYPSLFEDPDGYESDYNKLEQLLDPFDAWKQERTRETRDVILDENDAQGIIDYIYQEMLAPMMANIDEQRETIRARKETGQMSIDGFSDPQSSMVDETAQLENLRKKVQAVKKAVVEKTEAFNEEKSVVEGAVYSEIAALCDLLNVLQQVADQIGAITNGCSKINNQDVKLPEDSLDQNKDDLTELNQQQHVEYQADDIVKDYALDSTLQTTNSILNEISGKLNQEQDFSGLIGPLKSAADELKNAANGIVQHQKAQKSDTSVAMARIQDPEKLAYMSGLAKDSVGSLGTDTEIESYQALVNGLVKFEGVFKNAQGQWEGFTVKINEHNEAVDLAVKKHSALANQLNKEQEEEVNTYKYNKEEVEARAQRHLEEYAAQGKNATVQFADSGRYTITILEEIDGLSKKIFQTFDENDKMIERTTVTMSNNQKTKLDNLRKKLIDDGIDKGLISDKDETYADYQAATDELNKMNVAYSKLDGISDEEITKWKQQIVLVQQLGDKVSDLIKQRQTIENRNKENQTKFDTSYAKQADDFARYEQEIKDASYITNNLKNRVDALIASLALVSDSISLNAWQEEFKVLKHDIDLAKKSFENFNNGAVKAARGTANKLIKGLDFNVTDAGLSSSQQFVADEYRYVIDLLDEYKINIEEGKQIELDRINSVIYSLKDAADHYRLVNDLSSVSTKNFGATATRREATRYEKLQALALDSNSGYSFSSEFMDQFNRYKVAYDQLIAKQKEFTSLDSLTNEQVAEWDRLKDSCMQAGKEIEKAVRASEKLSNSPDVTSKELLGDDFVNNATNRKRALIDFAKGLHDVSSASIIFDKNYTKCAYAVENGDGTFTQMTATFDGFKKQIVETAGSTKEATSAFGSFLGELKDKARSIVAYLISITGIEEVFQAVRQGIEYVKEIDSALTELKKVTNATSAEYDAFLQKMSKTAGVVGSTASELTTMAAEWARLGYTMEESAQLAESTAILLNVSEFEDATTASEALISTMQAFQYTADESQHVVDILNEVGKILPVDNYIG